MDRKRAYRTIFAIWLSWLGRRPAFDKVWTVASVLLMGVLATLFSFDLWTG
jgi:hypothetical protein